MRDRTFEYRDPLKLTDHPLHDTIYGDETDDDLIDSITLYGVHVPLMILPDGVVLAGSRRRRGAVKAGLAKVPCSVRHDLTDRLEIEDAIVHANKQRVKTTSQLAREAAHLMEIEKERARIRKLQTQFQGGKSNGPPTVRSPQKHGKNVHSSKPDPSPNGRARDSVAKHLDVSPNTAQGLATAGKAIKDAAQSGDIETAQELTKTLDTQGVKPTLDKLSVGPQSSPGRQSAPKAIREVEQAVGRAVRLADKAVEVHGGESVHSRKVMSRFTALKKSLAEWKKDAT